MRAFEGCPTGLLRARARANREIDIGLVCQPLVKRRILRQVEADYVLAFRGHRCLLVIAPLREKHEAARGQWESGHYTDACRAQAAGSYRSAPQSNSCTDRKSTRLNSSHLG